MFFLMLPSVAEGFMVRVRRGGQRAGAPKMEFIAKGLIERGLMRLDTTSRQPRLFLTKIGLTAVRAMVADRRFTNSVKFAHVRRELGWG